MRHIPIKSVCCITAAFAVVFGMAGCSKPGVLNTEPTNYSENTAVTITVFDAGSRDDAAGKPGQTPAGTSAPAVTTAAEPSKGGLPKSGSINGLNYNLITSNVSAGDSKERGYYVFQSEDDKAYPYKILIAMGEKSTGGYGIAITDIQYDGSELAITVRETTPPPDGMVTEAFTYPACAVEISGRPLTFKVVQEGGTEYKCLLTRMEKTINDPENGGRLIAWLGNGAGEIMYKTYVYELYDGKFRVENVRSVTKSWGSAKWIDTVAGTAVVSTRQEVVDIAKKFGSCGFVMYPGSNYPGTIEGFLANNPKNVSSASGMRCRRSEEL